MTYVRTYMLYCRYVGAIRIDNWHSHWNILALLSYLGFAHGLYWQRSSYCCAHSQWHQERRLVSSKVGIHPVSKTEHQTWPGSIARKVDNNVCHSSLPTLASDRITIVFEIQWPEQNQNQTAIVKKKRPKQVNPSTCLERVRWPPPLPSF